MLLFNPSPYVPIKVYEITTLDMLKVVLIGYGLFMLAFVAGLLVFWPEYQLVRAAEKRLADGEPVESAETVELPRRNRPHTTGTVCAAGYRREAADDITTVIDTRQVCR